MQGGSLTGARMVLEGAHAVSVGWERAHTLPRVRQPALDGPVGAARVHMLVHKLRRDVSTAAQRPAQPLRVEGEGMCWAQWRKCTNQKRPSVGPT